MMFPVAYFCYKVSIAARQIRQRYCLGEGVKGALWPFFYSLQCWGEYLSYDFFDSLRFSSYSLALTRINFWESLDQYTGEWFEWEKGRSILAEVVGDFK
jgi:hypothetical protein